MDRRNFILGGYEHRFPELGDLASSFVEENQLEAATSKVLVDEDHLLLYGPNYHFLFRREVTNTSRHWNSLINGWTINLTEEELTLGTFKPKFSTLYLLDGVVNAENVCLTTSCEVLHFYNMRGNEPTKIKEPQFYQSRIDRDPFWFLTDAKKRQ